MVKRCCKNIDITNPEVITPFIENCLKRHWKRHDFRRMIREKGFDYEHILTDSTMIRTVARAFAVEIADTVKHRTIPKFRTWAKKRMDYTSGKERMIGNETSLQRLYDYVAVYACQELWDRKLVHQQCSSIPNRGQVYGMKLIRHYILTDNRSLRYAKKHRIRYTSKCRYFVKLDIRHCYESIDRKLLMERLEHDIKNPDIIYLWKCLLSSYDVDGLLIGALPSQFLSQYMIANIYRKAMNSHVVSHMVIYMDDMLLFASNRRKLLRTVYSLIEYARNELHLTIKPAFAIKRLKEEPIDMMGYVVHANGKVTVRAKTFIRARRQVVRFQCDNRMSYEQAKRLASYKGYIIHSDSFRVKLEYGKSFRFAQNLISLVERSKIYGMGNLKQRTAEG